jgi:ArsR family transcriptional regulator
MLSPQLFRALCDPNRLTILARLAECCGALKVSEVAECCPVDISVVSRHLATLRDAGVLQAERRGKEVFYTLKARSLVSTLRTIADAIETCCGGSEEEKRNG